MPLSIATWNINSVRLRIRLVTRFLRTFQPDVLCLQEIKCLPDNFPYKPLRRLGYSHIAVKGQRGYHGVAIVSRIPFERDWRRDFCGKDDARHIAVTLQSAAGPLDLHNFYVPAGGDEPDPAINPKFDHKLSFLDEMLIWLRELDLARPTVLVGDLNVAPFEQDVWSHRQLLKVVSHTPMETERLNAIVGAGNWIDVARHFVPHEEKVYTWWSYRARDWKASNRGRRLDHIWVNPPLADRLRSFEVFAEARGWTRPSDHVPVIATLNEKPASDGVAEEHLAHPLQLTDRPAEPFG